MSIRDKADIFLKTLDDTNEKDLILYFLIESQLLEYGIIYLLSQLPFFNGPELKDIEDKTLGQLINELEKTKDSDMVRIAGKAREFNELRKDIIHNILFLEKDASLLKKDLKDKISLAREIEKDIENEFDYVYEMTLGVPYGTIF
jgi:hypothetical protein